MLFHKMKVKDGRVVERDAVQTARSLFAEFKRRDLLEDRREYDVADLMKAYPGLSQKEAEKLYDMIQQN